MPLRRRTRENLHAFEKVHSVARCARTGFPGRERGKGTGGRRPTSPPKTTNRGLQKNTVHSIAPGRRVVVRHAGEFAVMCLRTKLPRGGRETGAGEKEKFAANLVLRQRP